MTDLLCPPLAQDKLYTAHELAAMPLAEAKKLLEAQEIAFMQRTFGRRLLNDMNEIHDNQFGLVVCVSLDNRIFRWEAREHCELCDGSGTLGAKGQSYACPACADSDLEEFATDYDGNLLEDEPSA